MDIDPPDKLGRKEKALKAGMALAEQLSWIGPAIALFGPFLPDRFEEDQVRWQEEVTTTLNWLARLHRGPQISRGSLAWLFALLTSRVDREGIGEEFISHEMWKERFPDETNIAVGDALAELEHARWIRTQPNANSPSGVGGFMGTSLLFAHVHPWTHGLYPSEDAKTIAQFALENFDHDAEAISAMAIDEALEWERRRLYPALAFLADEIIPEDTLERHYDPRYPFIWLYMNGNVRRILRDYTEVGNGQ